MLRTMIRLPNGSEIFSGPTQDNVIKSVKLTECVNEAKELTLGSVCANMLELDLQTPNGGLEITAGDEITAYKVEDNGQTHLIGLFTTVFPKRTTANTLRLTAYDRISKLDKDLTDWLAGLQDWPYSLFTFADMVCKACGLVLKNTQIPNGDYEVQHFTARGVTGRKLMQWIGEAAGRFCRATPEGQIEFAWYEPSDVTLTPDGERFYYQNGLSYEDYAVSPIEKVHVKLTQDDAGVVWPDEMGEKNTYIISGNYLLSAGSMQQQPIAKTLYEQMKAVTYTPCSIRIPACLDLHAGHTVQITDRNGKTFLAYVMKKIQSGQLDTLECTGSQMRDSTIAVNNEKYRATRNQRMEIKKSEEGLAIDVMDYTNEALDSINEDLSSVSGAVSALAVKADNLSASVTEIKTTAEAALNGLNSDVETLSKEVSTKMTADAVQIQIQTAMEKGTSKVVTQTGFTFNENGMTVAKSGKEMKTRITEDGMTVYQNNSAVLEANNKGVDAKNLHATTYLMVGGRSRFENYGSNRTGCFWIGG